MHKAIRVLVGCLCVLMLVTICYFPAQPVKADSWTTGKFDIDYSDCSTDNSYGGFYVFPVIYNSKTMITLSYIFQIQFKYDGTWYTKSLDMDAAGHPSCTEIDQTAGGKYIHGNRFHWNLGSGSKAAGVDYWAYFMVPQDGNSPEISFYQIFNYTAPSSPYIITDYKTWWKFLPHVNGDSDNVVTTYESPSPPHTLSYEQTENKATWTQYRFIDSTDSSNLTFNPY